MKRKRRHRWWVHPVFQKGKRHGAYHRLVRESALNDDSFSSLFPTDKRKVRGRFCTHWTDIYVWQQTEILRAGWSENYTLFRDTQCTMTSQKWIHCRAGGAEWWIFCTFTLLGTALTEFSIPIYRYTSKLWWYKVGGGRSTPYMQGDTAADILM